MTDGQGIKRRHHHTVVMKPSLWRRLMDYAEQFGYVNAWGPFKNAGNVSRLLRAVAEGELRIVKG